MTVNGTMVVTLLVTESTRGIRTIKFTSFGVKGRTQRVRWVTLHVCKVTSPVQCHVVHVLAIVLSFSNTNQCSSGIKYCLSHSRTIAHRISSALFMQCNGCSVCECCPGLVQSLGKLFGNSYLAISYKS